MHYHSLLGPSYQNKNGASVSSEGRNKTLHRPVKRKAFWQRWKWNQVEPVKPLDHGSSGFQCFRQSIIVERQHHVWVVPGLNPRTDLAFSELLSIKSQGFIIKWYYNFHLFSYFLSWFTAINKSIVFKHRTKKLQTETGKAHIKKVLLVTSLSNI